MSAHTQDQAQGAGAPAESAQQNYYYIQEYRVEGTKLLPPIEVERAVYPYLGPRRTEKDVEAARAALEGAYRANGYQTVQVQVPEQTVVGGVIQLKVVEAAVGRLRVNGAKYHLPSRLKKRAPSMAPGNVPNWNDVQRDIVALNRTADLRVTPSLTQGAVEGTVDIDLAVEDSLPLHGSLELNNRHTPDTTELRVNGALSYANLWQAGHSLGGSFQLAPERLDDAQVYSLYYLAPLPGAEGVALFVQGTHQDSDVSTLGGTGVVGRGSVYSGRVLFTLPGKERFFHNLAVGVDYKDFEENVTVGDSFDLQTPITYYPASLLYSATWLGEKYETALSAGVNWHFRGLGSEAVEFDNKRFDADGGFFYFRGELSHLQTLPADFQAYIKVQGQLADRPLINNEQYSGGGLSNSRGYLESTALGDNALFGTLEFRSPSLFGGGKEAKNELRLHVFGDVGVLTLNNALPEQDDNFVLASLGGGLTGQLFGTLNASLDLGVPLESVAATSSGDALLTFRLWAEF